MLSIIILIVIAIIITVWYTENEIPLRQQFMIPPPKYGDGPYGYGIYLPPAEILSSSIAYT